VEGGKKNYLRLNLQLGSIRTGLKGKRKPPLGIWISLGRQRISEIHPLSRALFISKITHVWIL